MDMANNENQRHIVIEANALTFRGSKEVFGICPLSDEEMERLCIEKATEDALAQNFDCLGYSIENDPTIPKIEDTVSLKIDSTIREKSCRYHFVATHQKTEHVIIAVHTLGLVLKE